MKRFIKNNCAILFLFILFAGYVNAYSQDSSKPELIVKLSYFLLNNKIPYLQVNTKTKVQKRFQPVSGLSLKLYLDKDSASNLVGKVVTDLKGSAMAMIPPSLQEAWNASLTHTFIAVTETNQQFDASKVNIAIAKARLILDTATEGVAKEIIAMVTELKDSQWVPVQGVEMKIAVKRSGGDLSVSEEETYTTDSTGKVTAEFKRDFLPGDKNDNIILVAKVEDNDQYGNLVVEKTVPWGMRVKEDNSFDKRTLFATGPKAPVWLIVTAVSIIVAVWGVIVYLIIQLIKIGKLGRGRSN